MSLDIKCIPPGEKCVEFDLSRGCEGPNDPYPSAKIMIAGGCSASTAVGQMLRSILDLQNFTHPGPCKMRSELLLPRNNRCLEGEENMTGAILNTISTLDRFGQRLVAKFFPFQVGSVDPEIHKYATFDAFSLHRRNVFDVGICRAMDCFNRKLGRIFFENGTTSTLCFDRRKHPELNFKIDVDVDEMKKFMKEEAEKTADKGYLFNGRRTNAYTAEDLTGFQTSDEDEDLRSSFDAWVGVLSSLRVEPNRGVIDAFLRETRRTAPRRRPKSHRFVVMNAMEVRERIFNNSEMERFQWMWRD